MKLAVWLDHFQVHEVAPWSAPIKKKSHFGQGLDSQE